MVQLGPVQSSRWFWGKVKRTASGCWIWIGATYASGYGQIWVNGRLLRAHRVFFEHLVGPIAEGMELDHLCRNTKCVNPDHMEPVSHQENCARGLAGLNQSMKTHCPNGHAYSGGNLYIRPGGSRECRACGAAQMRRYRLRLRGRGLLVGTR